jgi:hypothetical protein
MQDFPQQQPGNHADDAERNIVAEAHGICLSSIASFRALPIELPKKYPMTPDTMATVSMRICERSSGRHRLIVGA